MTTRSLDPAGQHWLPMETPYGRGTTDHWNASFPIFDVAFDQQLLPGGVDPKPLRVEAVWLIAAGSDLLLQCEQATGSARTDYIVRTYDSTGNPLNVLGQFQDAASALAALPTLMTVAHMLYPNFLLMPRDAELNPKEKA